MEFRPLKCQPSPSSSFKSSYCVILYLAMHLLVLLTILPNDARPSVKVFLSNGNDILTHGFDFLVCDIISADVIHIVQ